MFTTVLGTGLLLLFVFGSVGQVVWWQNLIATSLTGIAAGICFNSVFDTALGNLKPVEAGSASGSLSAIQQIVSGIGSALVTTIFIGTLADGTAIAMATTLAVVLAIAVLCLFAVPLLRPRQSRLRNDAACPSSPMFSS